MKTKDNYLKKAVLRLVSGVLASVMMACSIPQREVSAEPETTAPAETTVSAALSDTGNSSGSVSVTENGTEKDFDSGEQWEDPDVQGSDEPTVKINTNTDETFQSNVDDNVYSLTVSTGIQPGSCVEYFTVRYTDNNNIAQTKYLFPKAHSLDASFSYINGIAESTLKGDVFGYTRKKAGAPTALGAWSVDEYLFVAETGINSITSIEAFMSDGSWTVQGMTVSKVNYIGGIAEYGRISGKYFYNIGKSRICTLKSKKNGSVTISAKGDKLVTVAGANSTYFSLRTVKDDNLNNKTPISDRYTVRIDFADRPDAGLESLLRTNAADSDPISGNIVEDLAVEVEYTDLNGWTRNVTMPVLLSVLSQYDDDRSQKKTGAINTIGLAQRGDTLAFSGYLPEYASMISVRVFLGNAARTVIWQTADFHTSADVSDQSEKFDNDSVAISGISVYKGDCVMSNTPDGVDTATGETLTSYSYTFDYESPQPLMYFTTTRAEGIKINPGTSDKFDMTAYEAGSPLIAAQNNITYMLRLKTDDMQGAGTNGNIKARVTYQNTSGDKLSTNIYDVKNEVLNYLGYWPTTENNNTNYGYYYGVKAGGYVEFPVELDGLAVVTGVELSLDGASEDEWQLKSISLTVIDNLSKVRVYAQESSTDNNMATTYRVCRGLERTVIPPFPIDLKKHKLFTSGDSYLFSTETGTSSSLSEVNYNDLRYSMTYEQTKLNLGFVKRRKIYDVIVKVADDSTTTNANGDSGSKNQFYFQLRFKNGSSGFVLANQQLSADGFRTGCQEQFSIAVNRDYSDLREIRIIPEDIQDNSDVFDKLNIENITVTERANGGSSLQYIIDNVGWIDIDFHDSAEKNSIRGQEGRLLSEIAGKKYTVTSKKNVVNLLCEVATEPWDTDFLQVHGSIACDLRYIDTSGVTQTISFDVVSRMADYMNKTPKTFEAASDGSNQALYNNMGTVSDPDWMLRPNHTDRFILPPISDAERITGMTLYAVSRNNKPAKWVISGINISRIISDNGNLQLTSNNEYMRGMVTDKLCSMVMDTKEVVLYLPAGTPEPLDVEFSHHIIDWSENSAWISSVTRLPESENDTLDVYIYPGSGTKDIDGVNASVAVQYTQPFSQVMQIKENALRTYGSGTQDAVFYVEGLPVTGMQNLYEMGLSCRNDEVLFDRAIVQQVREDVVVKTYEFSFNNSSALLGVSAKPNDFTTVQQPKKQVLMMSFSPDTEDITLFPEQNDIAVSLRYKSTIDNGSKELYTPYVYFTDVGINKLTHGMMAEVPFEVPYVGEITGYRIVSFGNIKASVEGALGLTYSFKEKQTDETTGDTIYIDEKRDGCVSFDQSYPLQNAVETYDVTARGMTGEGALAPLDMTITTGSAIAGRESGTDTAVRMTFNYTDHLGALKMPTTEISDIRAYIQSDTKQFETGQPARVRLFLRDCEQLVSMSILPYNSTSTASWLVSDIQGTLKLGEAPSFSRSLNKEIFQSTGAENIILKDIGIETTVSANNSAVKVKEHIMNIVLEGGRNAVFTVLLSNTSLGFDAKASWLVNGTETDVPATMTRTNARSVTFTAPVNTYTAPQTYSITISSLENPAVKDVINITVPVSAAATTSVSSRTPQSRSSAGVTPSLTTQTTVSTAATIPSTETAAAAANAGA